jgi:hypothetical protein
MLMQGLPKDWLNMLEETHMSKLIRFMCVKNSKYGLMCMGGMWQKDLDGGQEVRCCFSLASCSCVNAFAWCLSEDAARLAVRDALEPACLILA